jgi:hypothetical protein
VPSAAEQKWKDADIDDNFRVPTDHDRRFDKTPKAKTTRNEKEKKATMMLTRLIASKRQEVQG